MYIKSLAPDFQRISTGEPAVSAEVGIHRLDKLVENQVILELKTVERLNKAHYASNSLDSLRIGI